MFFYATVTMSMMLCNDVMIVIVTITAYFASPMMQMCSNYTKGSSQGSLPCSPSGDAPQIWGSRRQHTQMLVFI